MPGHPWCDTHGSSSASGLGFMHYCMASKQRLCMLHAHTQIHVPDHEPKHIHTDVHAFIYMHLYLLRSTQIRALAMDKNTHIHLYTAVFLTFLYTHIFSTFLCTHTYIRTYVHTYISYVSMPCVFLYVHMHTYIHVYIYAYIHIYTHIHKPKKHAFLPTTATIRRTSSISKLLSLANVSIHPDTIHTYMHTYI